MENLNESYRGRVELAHLFKRVLALVLDNALLSATGFALALGFAPAFSRLGWAAKLVGFFISLAYFTALNGPLGGGQTVGQRICKIMVIGRDGRFLSWTKSLLRSLIIPLVWLCNNWNFPLGEWVVLQTLAASFVMLALFLLDCYFALFNTETRQTFHDLLVDSFVINQSENPEAVSRFNSPRVYWLSAIPLALVLLTTIYMYNLTRSPVMSEFLEIRDSISTVPGVDNVAVFSGVKKTTVSGSEAQSVSYLRVSVYRNVDGPPPEDLSRAVAALVAGTDAAARQDTVIINILSGFDIGITSKWQTVSFSNTAAQWKNVLEEGQ